MYRCILCDKKFKTLNEAKQHLAHHHKMKENPYSKPEDFIEYIIPIDISEIEGEIGELTNHLIEVDIKPYRPYPEITIKISNYFSINKDLAEQAIKAIIPIIKKYNIPEDKILVKRIEFIPDIEEDYPALTISILTKGVWEQ